MDAERVTVHDVAAYLLEQTGNLATMKFQKLLYYCNAWHLAIRGTPLFRSRIEAWRYGPVVREIYAHHRQEAAVDSWPLGNPANLSNDQKGIVDVVVQLYGAKSGWALAEMTHKEDPWINARAGLQESAHSEDLISEESIKVYFQELLRNGATEK